jgi:ATP-dependent exoDNAse (exonuclease V) beta subunit
MKKEKPTATPNPPRVFVTEASAGGGKTYALARHYLKLLLSDGKHPEEIKNILAITFTNKAAREMKERILELLKKLAFDKFSDKAEKDNLLKRLELKEEPARLRARALVDFIIANYSHFQVKTIDSFINMVLLGCAFRFGLSASFKIKDDFRDCMAYGLDQCIDFANHDSDVRKRFNDFLEQYIYLENKNSWFPKEDILAIMGALFADINSFGGFFREYDLKGANIVVEKKKLLEDAADILKKLDPDAVDKLFIKMLKKFVDNNPDSFNFKDITDSKTLMKEELPVKKGKDKLLPKSLAESWVKFRASQKRLAYLEAMSLFNRYIDIFKFVYVSMMQFTSKEDVLFLEELNNRAGKLINENGVTVPERYYYIATRLAHFLIDEFQDTSRLQWDNLWPMVDESLSKNGTLFYVGDIKQAIFRFRGGDVRLFNEVKAEFKSEAREDPLKENRRSQKEIVEFNNTVFSKENLIRFLSELPVDKDRLRELSDKNKAKILEVFSGSRQEYEQVEEKSFGCVRVELINQDQAPEPPESEPEEEEEEEVDVVKARLLGLIKELTEAGSLSYKDIAVLCRGNKDVEKVSGWLVEAGIGVESEKTLNIKNNLCAREIIAFLKFLNSPVDNISFVAFLLGDIFSEASGIPKDELSGFVFESNRKSSRKDTVYIYTEFKKKYRKAWDELIEPFFQNVGFISHYELVADIYGKLKVFEKFPAQQGFFMHILQLIKDSEEDYPGLGDFLGYFVNLQNNKNMYVNSSDADAVKVTTIHKAKGLGFHTVIIPFLSLYISKIGGLDRAAKVSYVVKPQADGLALLRLDEKYALLSDEIREEFQRNFMGDFVDELNAIYVALTRAKNEMYILIPDNKNNSARLLIPDTLYSCGSHRQYPKKEEKGVDSLHISPVRHSVDWVDFLKDEFKASDAVRNRKLTTRGNILHTIMASIGDLSRSDPEESLKNGLAAAKTAFPFIEDFSEHEAVIRKVISAGALKDFFYLNGAQSFQEKEIVDTLGRTYRLDRLIVLKDEARIIDYKTTVEDASRFKEQLDTYRKILSSMYPGKPLKAFIISLEEATAQELHE